MEEKILGIEKQLEGTKRNIRLAKYTTFKIGGPAKYFFEAKTQSDLIRAIEMAKRLKMPFFLLAGGSNLLVSDKGFNGLVIKIQNTKYKIPNTKIIVEAGTPLSLMVSEATKNSLTGLEWAVGIPGTIGGAIFGNAGAKKESIGNVIRNVEVFDTKVSKVKNFSNKDCQFKYRDSIFKKKKNFIILSAKLKLKKGNKKEIKEKIKKFISHRKATQPLNFPSAGSVFKNPSPAKILKKFRRARGFFAGELIEKCGLKGKRIGNVKVSEKHANFIVNLGNGRAKDVKKLIKLIKNKVKNKFGIKLEEEIQYFDH